jgi:hypothetical protein
MQKYTFPKYKRIKIYTFLYFFTLHVGILIPFLYKFCYFFAPVFFEKSFIYGQCIAKFG